MADTKTMQGRTDLINVEDLPTHLAKVAKRVTLYGVDDTADTFLNASYIFESLLKTLGLVLITAVSRGSVEDAYRLTYQALRADGIGKWDELIQAATQPPTSSFLKPELRPLIIWLTKRRNDDDSWFLDAVQRTGQIINLIDTDTSTNTRISTVKSLLSRLVNIRNKTRGHGAKGADFYAAVNSDFVHIIMALLADCPVMQYEWSFVSRRGRKQELVSINLKGLAPTYQSVGNQDYYSGGDTILFLPPKGNRPYYTLPLLRTNRECSEYWLPNGHFTNGKAEFINYASGGTCRIELPDYIRPPAALPPSETVGLSQLDVQSNVFGNLPPIPAGYVQRDQIQSQLHARLIDRNHTIITLHGPGGIGKTSLALHAAHRLAENPDPHFESIVWFSARDLDLNPEGPKRVGREVSDLESVAQSYGRLFGAKSGVDDFAQVLQQPAAVAWQKGTLFIFDNFETLTDSLGFQEFLDTHTHLPNKVLITSRERAFKADYPIEVNGMTVAEAQELVAVESRRLSIAGLIDDAMFGRMYKYSQGHAYVLRVLLGEIAKEGRFIQPSRAISQRHDVVNAVFERSFDKLSFAARHVFLTIGSRNSLTLELSLIVALARNDVDVLAGIDECVRLSLISQHHTLDGQSCYGAPHLARVFAKKKLKGDPEKILFDEYHELLQAFGVITEEGVPRRTIESAVNQFIGWCNNRARLADPAEIQLLDDYIEDVANLWPEAWLLLADFRKKWSPTSADVGNALRRAVEEMPNSINAWLNRAEYASTQQDLAMLCSALAGAIDCDPSDTTVMHNAATRLVKFVSSHKESIPVTERARFLTPVRERLAEAADALDDRAAGAVAWLYLLGGDKPQARYFTQRGLRLNPNNSRLQKLLRQIDS